jgi:hypothetical protein
MKMSDRRERAIKMTQNTFLHEAQYSYVTGNRKRKNYLIEQVTNKKGIERKMTVDNERRKYHHLYYSKTE